MNPPNKKQTACHVPHEQRSTIRDNEEKRKIKTRLSKIEGQIRGINQMVDDDRYCEDLLIQLSAADKALKSLAYIILNRHLHSCVVNHIEDGDYTVIDEVVGIFKKFQG